jgi:hypothetical protein
VRGVCILGGLDRLQPIKLPQPLAEHSVSNLVRLLCHEPKVKDAVRRHATNEPSQRRSGERVAEPLTVFRPLDGFSLLFATLKHGTLCGDVAGVNAHYVGSSIGTN